MIISGSTAYYRVNFSSPPVLSMVDTIVFSFAADGHVVLKKRYPNDTLIIDDGIVIPLSQKDTAAICGHGTLEAQINYNSGSVAKTAVARYYVAPSASTELVDSSAPDGFNSEVTVYLELEDPAYIKGDPGISATHAWNGTVLTITSASGTSSADLKGAKGDKGNTGEKGDKGDPGSKGDKGDIGPTGPAGPQGAAGYSPIRGTDYWTADDRTQVVQDVLAALPAWEGGSY